MGSGSISEEKADALLENTEGVEAESKTPAEITREPSKTEEDLVEDLKAEITEPCVQDVCAADNLDFSDGEMGAFVEPSVCEVETTEEKFSVSELPFALWKIILFAALALLWACMRTEDFQSPMPTLGEEFEGETQSIPMLGFDEDATETAVAVAVDEFEGGKTKTDNSGSESTALRLYSEAEEEKWGMFAVIVLAMMMIV